MREIYVHIATLIVLLAGAALVVWELRQTKTLVQAQVVSDTFSYHSQQQLAFLGEKPLSALAKACSNKELNEEDALVLMYYFSELATRAEKILITSRFLTAESPWEEVARVNFRLIFSVPAGEVWWEYWKRNYPLPLHRVADQVLANERENCSNMISGMINANHD